jgi:hypothetical protein
MRIRIAVPDAATHPDVLNAALEAVTKTDERLIQAGQVPHADEAIAAGLKWKPEPPGDEHFDHAAKIVQRGWGDCDDLAPYKAASLRVTGEDPGARAVVIPSGPKKWHAIVERSDGTDDDPSADAGMYEYRAPLQPRLVGPESKINIATKRIGRVWAARCDVPWRGERVAISGHGLGLEKGVAVANALEGVYVIGDSADILEPEHVGKLCMMHGLLCGDDELVVSGANILPAHHRDDARRAVNHIGPTTRAAQRAMAARRGYCAVRCGDWREDDSVVGHEDTISGFYE